MNEKLIERKLFNRVRKLGGYALKIQFTTAGFPDRLVIMPYGRIYFVELKSTGKNLRPLQRVWCNTIKKMGQKYYVIYDENTYIAFINQLEHDLYT